MVSSAERRLSPVDVGANDNGASSTVMRTLILPL
jgi:hypothetical protein